jgi:hypothetical protein
MTQLWTDSWDSSAATGQLGRLPSQVKITLVLNHGPGDKPDPVPDEGVHRDAAPPLLRDPEVTP